jgi:polypyrimidine tract-binding protein 2
MTRMRKKQKAESNILLASIENMQYVVTIDVRHEVTCSK